LGSIVFIRNEILSKHFLQNVCYQCIKTFKLILMKKISNLTRIFSLLLIAALAFSCSKDDEGGLDENSDGSFSVSITGSESFSFSGIAVYEEIIVNDGTPENSGTNLVMTFTNESGSAMSFSIIKASPDGFGEGTYSFLEDPDDNEVFILVTLYSEVSESTYIISSGSITIDNRTDNFIQGSLDIELTDFSENNVRVTGEFSAKDANIFLWG